MKKDKPGCDLQTCMLCRLCLKEWTPAIDTHRKQLSFKKGAMLFREGDPVTGIYFVYSGSVKVHKHWGNDKELIVRFAQKGDIVGHRGMGREMVYPISATALEPVTVCYVDLTFFQTSLQVNHGFLYELMLFYAQELQESEMNMRNLAHMSVKGRIARALLQLQDKFGINANGALQLQLTRQDLAGYTGATYETVFRVMSEFVKEGLITVTAKEIAVTNVSGLLRLVKEAEL
ncbi:Crp/Fnr family transcriptional regulator [Chitinophaga agrisoli]|uniref:Crp/Fnr family transcriptional regulator n=1 Tax=Chitinophaga agrisoli TaxID=2607653 RepID=A0A5B2VNV2_9BACT|nr:Crp/Fnr family transcriptional regulator [Chitinophaga agrisoli]KAA2240360.1 Crp/Fnr family transcriptional regulator [Chitinophaga agrisoli]